MIMLRRTILHPLMIFAILVALTGGGLWAAGVMRNPVVETFNQARILTSMQSGGQGRPQAGQQPALSGQAPAQSSRPQGGQPTAGAGQVQGGAPAGDQRGGTNWHQGLFILTDLWYIAAVTLSVIVVQRVVSFAPRLRHARA